MPKIEKTVKAYGKIKFTDKDIKGMKATAAVKEKNRK